jgi:hypothetical protein
MGGSLTGASVVGLNVGGDTGGFEGESVAESLGKVGSTHMPELGSSIHVHFTGHHPGVEASYIMIPSSFLDASFTNVVLLEGRRSRISTAYL